jgi:ferrous iron transport protein B
MPTSRTLRIALAGNPNAGKTSLFNLLSGLHQQVGNWPGVTVERKLGRLEHAGYAIEIVDLPGIYSLTAHSLEEQIARDYILTQRPDVVVNVVDAANLVRHLYLSVQFIEMGLDVVLALNMWDEFEKSGARLDCPRMEALLGAPVVPTIGHRGRGRAELLDAIVQLAEARHALHRHVPITLGRPLEEAVSELAAQLATGLPEGLDLPPRYLAVKLLEGDAATAADLYNRAPALRPLLARLEERRARLRASGGVDPARQVSDARRGFIAGLLHEVQSVAPADRMAPSRRIDRVLTHRWLGLPIFVAGMWLLFNLTFTLGAPVQALLARMVELLAHGLAVFLPAGWVRALIVDGIFSGVGAVLVFVPNILLLFLGVAVLEESGYMARAAFIMDRLMHVLGLHGKSFIPMLMGFGCSVPAILATRTLENRRDRILTALLVPHMSCSARLPVYVLLAGAFFGRHAGNVVAIIYLLGIVVAVLVGRLLSATLFRSEQSSFVMELPPYRRPTLRGLVVHTRARVWHYLRKMGGVILIAACVLWLCSVYPAPSGARRARGAHCGA